MFLALVLNMEMLLNEAALFDSLTGKNIRGRCDSSLALLR